MPTDVPTDHAVAVEQLGRMLADKSVHIDERIKRFDQFLLEHPPSYGNLFIAETVIKMIPSPVRAYWRGISGDGGVERCVTLAALTLDYVTTTNFLTEE